MIFMGLSLFVDKLMGHSPAQDWHVQHILIAAWAPPSISFLAWGSKSSKGSIKYLPQKNRIESRELDSISAKYVYGDQFYVKRNIELHLDKNLDVV
jgi:hypothetical protein